ncbi:hypothetical protein [Paraflavitalea pollutisoli]|uniref:hypothetical protein n=1 Tax=Paraflavitalea pollutisoli TaxID=3034143 RepID=UPI0023EC2CB3|nr:hypothetical protein [Paraflavitalea sp. H1-2-19X]
MKKIMLLGCLVFSEMLASAQYKTFRSPLTIGVDLGIPAYTAVGDMTGVLTGMHIKKEWRASTHFAASLSAGYNYFSGKVRSFDDKEVQHFSILPVLAGVKYYGWKKYFLGFETGLNIGLDANTSTRLALVPSLGAMLPVGKKQLEVALRYSGTKLGSTFPEASLLNRGGYSFLAIRLGWQL